MPDGNQPSGVLLGIVSTLPWMGDNYKREREGDFSRISWKSILAFLANKAENSYYSTS